DQDRWLRRGPLYPRRHRQREDRRQRFAGPLPVWLPDSEVARPHHQGRQEGRSSPEVDALLDHHQGWKTARQHKPRHPGEEGLRVYRLREQGLRTRQGWEVNHVTFVMVAVAISATSDEQAPDLPMIGLPRTSCWQHCRDIRAVS